MAGLTGDPGGRPPVVGRERAVGSMLEQKGHKLVVAVLSGGVPHTARSRWMMERLNRDGTFTNRDDDLDGLKTQLDQRFESAQVEVVGAVGIFSARI